MDYELAGELIQEVLDWVEDDSIFKPGSVQPRSVFGSGVSTMTVRVCTPEEYCRMVDIDVEASPFLDMRDLIDQIETWYNTLDSYGPTDFSEKISRISEQIVSSISSSETILKLAQIAAAADPKHASVDEMRNHLIELVSVQLMGVIHGRVVTLSKRYVPAEIVFEAYKDGYYPFGWDWEEECLLCLKV